jgi:hypothetical protein
MTEDQINFVADKTRAQLDIQLERNAISLNEYDKEVQQLDEWIKNEHKVNRVFR